MRCSQSASESWMSANFSAVIRCGWATNSNNVAHKPSFSVVAKFGLLGGWGRPTGAPSRCVKSRGLGGLDPGHPNNLCAKFGDDQFFPAIPHFPTGSITARIHNL